MSYIRDLTVIIISSCPGLVWRTYITKAYFCTLCESSNIFWVQNVEIISLWKQEQAYVIVYWLSVLMTRTSSKMALTPYQIYSECATFFLSDIEMVPWVLFLHKDSLTSCKYSILKIWLSWNHLIYTIWTPIPVIWHLYSKAACCCL